jgi:putative oxidoreductase
MLALAQLVDWHSQLARGLDHLRSLLLLATRCWVSWQFLKAGWLKLGNWDVTLELFRSEYQVPILSPGVAAICGTFGELFFPILLVFGLFTRIGALGLFAVNALAVVSYWHVIGGSGYEAALAQHVLWGFMLAMLAVFGGGSISLDRVKPAKSLRHE